MEPAIASVPLPLRLGTLDHYTMIVPNARAAAEFHVDVLGFTLLRVQQLDAGTAPPGGSDMLNYVLGQPDAPDRACVITEGLTTTSVFRRYLDQHGPGVHHVAFAIDDLDGAFETLRGRGVTLTSDAPFRDPLTGLRQVFIDRRHGGCFVELIERTRRATSATFTRRNMASLARTMERYLPAARATVSSGPAPEGTREASRRLSVAIARPAAAVHGFLADARKLPMWSSHRTVRRIDGGWVEVLASGDVSLEVDASPHGRRVSYRWSPPGAPWEVAFDIVPDRGGVGSRVTVDLATQGAPADPMISTVLAAELRQLKAVLEDHGRENTGAEASDVDRPHMEVFRGGGA